MNTTNKLAGAPVDSHEAITNPALDESLQNLLLNRQPEEFFQKFIPNLVGLFFVVGILVFFFYMIFGALGWITSGGDKAAVETARARITNAIIGIVILLSVFAIINIIEAFFGTDILRLDIGALKIE